MSEIQYSVSDKLEALLCVKFLMSARAEPIKKQEQGVMDIKYVFIYL